MGQDLGFGFQGERKGYQPSPRDYKKERGWVSAYLRGD